MGVRLYAPLLGRFLQTDPIYGGNPNTYTYPVDPINGYDLDGNSWASRARNWILRHKADIAFTALTLIPGIGQFTMAARVSRLIYVAAVRTIPAAARSLAARKGEQYAARWAVGQRNHVKQLARGGSRITNWALRRRDNRRTYSYFRTHGKSHRQIIESSGRTNRRVNRLFGVR
jgi:hypothetical protein